MKAWHLSKRERILLLVCVTVITGALLYTLVIESIINRWERLNVQIESKTTLLMRNTRLLNMYKMLESEYSKIRDFVVTGRNEEEELAKALKAIQIISQKSSCYIVNIKPYASRKLGSYKEISLEITAEGKIDELSHFLYQIETSKERLRVRRFAIMPKLRQSDKLKGVFFISKIIML